MHQDPQTATTSTGTPEAGPELAGKIRGAGWWQGSVVEAAVLGQVDPSLPGGATHWVVASQTCNLYSSDFERIAKVEFVGARLVPEGQGKAAMRGGRHPRQLEVLATGEAGQAWILCDSQARHWGARSCLAKLAPAMALRDDPGGAPDDRHKDIFARWLARGYTRLELSDELGVALDKGKFKQAIDNLVKRHERQIFGIFFELDAFDQEQVGIENIKPPCGMDLTVVVRTEEHVGPVSQSMSELFDDATVPNPSGPKRSRVDAMKADVGLSFAHKVAPAHRWTVPDIERSVRYNFPDHYSGSDEAGGE